MYLGPQESFSPILGLRIANGRRDNPRFTFRDECVILVTRSHMRHMRQGVTHNVTGTQGVTHVTASLPVTMLQRYVGG